MHQKYVWVNCDKDQYLSSDYFGNERNRNFAGYTWNPGKCTNVFYSLMADLWKNDRIVLLGQFRDENEINPIVKELRSRFDDMEYLGDAYYGIFSRFENMARYFTTADPDRFEETLDPERHLCIEPVFYRYVINHTKREFFYRYNLKSVSNWLNPLAFLLMSGKGRCSGKYGTWIGDRLELSNSKQMVKDLGYDDMTLIYKYRYFTDQDPTDKDW